MTLPRARDLGPLLVVWLISLGDHRAPARPRHRRCSIFGLFLVMLYVATGKTSWVVIGLVLVVGGAFLASRVLPYVGGRFANWLDAFNPEVIDADRRQLPARAGPLRARAGRAHRHRARPGPARHHPAARRATTSSRASARSSGSIGVFAILCLYMLFVAPRLPHRPRRAGRLRQAARRRPRRSSIALQVFIVVGGVTRVIPLTGLTTPFLAAGGSSLVANWIIVALLLRISDAVRNQPRGW